MGCLWDVTDKDIDAYSYNYLKNILNSKDKSKLNF